MRQEKNAHNAKENYTYDEKSKKVKVTYTFNEKHFDGKLVTSSQRGRFKNELGTEWAVRPYLGLVYLPFHLPFDLPYYVLDVGDADASGLYSSLICAAPDGSWMYIMTRRQVMSEASLEPHLAFVERLGFNRCNLMVFPQQAEVEATPAASDALQH